MPVDKMTIDEYIHLIRIAKLFLAITSDLEARAELRVFVGDCTGRVHQIRQRQRQAATGRNQK